MRPVSRQQATDACAGTTARPCPAVPAPPLSAELRAHTAEIHRSAERAGIVQAITRGRVSRRTYACYLRNLLPAYAALEKGLRREAGIPADCVLTARGLPRVPALHIDLEALVGPSWSKALPEFPASVRYREDIENATLAELVGHAYVRYLADLNGGAILRKALQRHLGLGPTELAFHAFPEIPDTGRFIEGFRAAIDSLVPDVERQVALDAAERAFRLNIRLADEVMGD